MTTNAVLLRDPFSDRKAMYMDFSGFDVPVGPVVVEAVDGGAVYLPEDFVVFAGPDSDEGKRFLARIRSEAMRAAASARTVEVPPDHIDPYGVPPWWPSIEGVRALKLTELWDPVIDRRALLLDLSLYGGRWHPVVVEDEDPPNEAVWMPENRIADMVAVGPSGRRLLEAVHLGAFTALLLRDREEVYEWRLDAASF